MCQGLFYEILTFLDCAVATIIVDGNITIYSGGGQTSSKYDVNADIYARNLGGGRPNIAIPSGHINTGIRAHFDDFDLAEFAKIAGGKVDSPPCCETNGCADASYNHSPCLCMSVNPDCDCTTGMSKIIETLHGWSEAPVILSRP